MPEPTYVALRRMLTYSPAVMGSYFLWRSGPNVPGTASIVMLALAEQNWRQGASLVDIGRRTYGMLKRSRVISPSSGRRLGARTRCSVECSSSLLHRMRKSPILNTTAPLIGGAAMNVPGCEGDSTSSPPTSSWNRKVQVEKSFA